MVGFHYPATQCVATVAWPRASVEDAQLIAQPTSTVVRLQFAPGESRTRYSIEYAETVEGARAVVARERDALAPKG